MFRLELQLARRYLTGRGGGFVSIIALFSFVGIILGVATLITVMAVMNGFRKDLIARILGFNGHLTLYAADGGALPGDYSDISTRIEKMKGVSLVFPVIQEQALISHRGRTVGVGLRALAADDLPLRAEIADSVSDEAHAGFVQGGLLLGQRLAERYAIGTGDSITLLDPTGARTALGTLPRQGLFSVAGTFALGFNEYDSGFVLMPLERAQSFLSYEGAVNAIEIFATDVEAAEQLVPILQEELGDGWRILDWRAANTTFLGALRVERNVMFLILSLIILVAAFNVVSGQYMLVNDKTKEIAILRTLGLKRSAVARVFLVCGGLIGTIGVFGGWLLGVLITDNIETLQTWVEKFSGAEVFASEVYFLSQLPAERDAKEVALIVGAALVISLLAPLWPALRAARLDPVEVLRNE